MHGHDLQSVSHWTACRIEADYSWAFKSLFAPRPDAQILIDYAETSQNIGTNAVGRQGCSQCGQAVPHVVPIESHLSQPQEPSINSLDLYRSILPSRRGWLPGVPLLFGLQFFWLAA